MTRAVERGQPADAASWYMQLTLPPTAELLRMLHAPDRFDFGMRYLYDDLPREVYTGFCGLALPEWLEGVLAGRERAQRLVDQTLAALDRRPARW